MASETTSPFRPTEIGSVEVVISVTALSGTAAVRLFGLGRCLYVVDFVKVENKSQQARSWGADKRGIYSS